MSAIPDGYFPSTFNSDSEEYEFTSSTTLNTSSMKPSNLLEPLNPSFLKVPDENDKIYELSESQVSNSSVESLLFDLKSRTSVDDSVTNETSRSGRFSSTSTINSQISESLEAKFNEWNKRSSIAFKDFASDLPIPPNTLKRQKSRPLRAVKSNKSIFNDTALQYLSLFTLSIFYICPGFHTAIRRTIGLFPSIIFLSTLSCIISHHLTSLKKSVLLRAYKQWVNQPAYSPAKHSISEKPLYPTDYLLISVCCASVAARISVWVFNGLYLVVDRVPVVGILVVNLVFVGLFISVGVLAMVVLGIFCWDVTRELHLVVLKGVKGVADWAKKFFKELDWEKVFED
ncbi:hypothetical protein HK098_006561 [Nowakowskiella sp. JEL0407]|nr:hypothetical protein HK098_006561 [Nowakowskiella sp. JEL0407]